VHYLDMPLQHASDKMLGAMKRGITRRKTYDLIQKFRKHVPDLAIRTTFIVGFPGETDKDFMELIEFMKEIRLNAWVFLRIQGGSPAAAMSHQVPEKIKAERLKEAMLTQQAISAANQAEWVGESLKILVEGHDPKTASWTGRSYMDAPEIDGRVYLSSKKPLKIGHFYNAQIQKSTEYDLFGSV
jgi:ribosomal protein S12 methylthiotransferase